jgi:hypothetical protein
VGVPPVRQASAWLEPSNRIDGAQPDPGQQVLEGIGIGGTLPLQLLAFRKRKPGRAASGWFPRGMGRADRHHAASARDRARTKVPFLGGSARQTCGHGH